MKGLAENGRSLANCFFVRNFMLSNPSILLNKKKNAFVQIELRSQIFKNNKAKDFIINYDLFFKINFTKLCSDFSVFLLSKNQI